MSSSGDESGAVAFPREQYEAIEGAVMDSARGRWFLSEFARRNRAADTLALLDALKKLENTVAPRLAQDSQILPDMDTLAETIRATRSEIAAVHSDRQPDGGNLPADGTIYERIAVEAKSAGNEIARRSISLRVIAGGLKSDHVKDVHVSAVEADAESLESLSWSQGILSERIAKAMGLLSHIDERLTGMVGDRTTPAMQEEARPYFARDEDLFEPAPMAAPRPETIPEKPRIVVIRRSKDEPVDIPLAG